MMGAGIMRNQLKSKMHRAVITQADPNYEGSIEIPADLMAAVGLWEREKVLVASIDTGARLETYVQRGPANTGNIIINGGAAHTIGAGERVTIMAFGLSEAPVLAQMMLCDGENKPIRVTERTEADVSNFGLDDGSPPATDASEQDVTQ